jgi:hypothetical protein
VPRSRSRNHAEFSIAGRESNLKSPQQLASFSSVIGRLFFFIFVAVVVFVPSLAHKVTDPGSIISSAATGLASVMPITALVLRAVPSAKTPWLCCEVTAILVCVALSMMIAYVLRGPFVFGSAADLDSRLPQTLVSISTAAAYTIPLVIALRRASTFEDRRRVKLCLVTALWPNLFLTPFYLDLVPNLVGFIFQYVASLCALFLGVSLFLDRNNHAIENSVPYAASYGWGLATSMVGYAVILTTPLSLLALNIVLSLYSTFLHWCFLQMATRITTMRDEGSFMLPGFFAVQLFQVQQNH